ncbi:MAG: hypothetical protein Q8O43_04025 [Dehalococcoidia bacterium]|nr:hypothetical protein [Dehalococcoidia bacterium]
MAEDMVNTEPKEPGAETQDNDALTQATKRIAELEQRLSVTGTSLSEAVAGYRTLVLQANPDILEELVGGESITAINESLVKAKNLAGRLRQTVGKEIARNRVPIGSPGRQTADLSALSPREKINYGIGGKK